MDFNKVRETVNRFFNGQYEVKKFLGEGSFSEVYLVKHRFLEDLRAMKIIKEPVRNTTNTRELFREVQIATQLRHENIINIYDAGIITDTNNLAYFVMEYVPGGDLQQYLDSFIKSDIQMPISSVLNIMKQILMGLNVLHSSKPSIVHRDLKLNNILLNYNAFGDIVIKISDFGFSKEVSTKLSDADIVGTRPYMAPECFSKSYSEMTDIYAVGVIFYQLLTARYPYDADRFAIEDLMELKVWKSPLKKPSYYNKNIPEKLDEIVLKCLEFDFKKRYQNAGELLEDIELLIDESDFSYEFKQSENDYADDYSDYIINDSLKEAFKLAKTENGLDEAIEILEREVLGSHDIRRLYGETLRMWKSRYPDVKLISKAFSVNLKAKNYFLSCDLLKEAIAYNPDLKNKYSGYIDLYKIFIDLSKDNNLIKAVISLEELMQSDNEICNIYTNTIDVLKTFSIEQIVNESIRLVKTNNLTGAASLMEFAVIYDNNIRQKYEYKLSLWKQNLEVYYKNKKISSDETIDYAIDLGTSDSVISYYNNGHPVIVKNHNTGDEITPSAVLITDDEICVGKTAKDAIIEKSSNAITEFKYNMGFSIPFNVKSSDKTLFPEELSAEILKDLRVSVFNQCGENLQHAVVCVPADSNPLKTKAILDACEIAGFRSYNLIFEPIAVSIAYDLNLPDSTWLIYDLGGSTFKASLIKDNGKSLEILSTKSIDNFGGNLFDWRIVDEILAPKIVGDLKLDDFRRNNPKYKKIFSKLKKAGEKAKIDLSSGRDAQINVSNLFKDYDLKHTLKREDFTKIIEPLLKITFDCVYDLLNQNELEVSDVCDIILVGGSCLSPDVCDLVENEFKMPVKSDIDPLTVVGRGAAVYAGSLNKPEIIPGDSEISLIINSDFNGRLFSMDKKQSFLGYEIEFINHKTGIFNTSPDIDGQFKINLDCGNYDIKVYNGDKSLSLDVKSPIKIENKKIFIPFFNKYFDISADTDLSLLTQKYDFLMDFESYLDEYGDVFEYVKRLMEISKNDKTAFNQANIYLNYLVGIVDKIRSDMKFTNLLKNVENKLEILNESPDLDYIIDNKDLDKLTKLYNSLIEQYVKSNKDKVIEQCFFSLNREGKYSDEAKSLELFDKGFDALKDNDYDKLLDIVNELYKLDGRFK